jgi:hypothetical membrane protein
MPDPVPPDAQPTRQSGGPDPAVGRWRVPAWALVPSSLAPLLLVVGPIVAAGLQPAGFDPVRDTISALAAQNANDRSMMTTVLGVVGSAHVGTAIGLVGAGVVARVLLGVVGLGTALVAVFPLPSGGGGSSAHAAFAVIAFLTLACWPLALQAGRWGPAHVGRPFPAKRRPAIVTTGVLLGLLGWLGVEQLLHGPHIGLSERVAAVAESTWPLIVVAAALVARRQSQTQPAQS